MPASRKLPILQSIPHAGLGIPPEIADRLAIDDITIFNECDLWADEIYDFKPSFQTLGVVAMPVSRVLIDANRPPDSLDSPDGAVKSHTSYGEPIYTDGLHPSEQEELLDRHWRSFHDDLSAAFRQTSDRVRLFLDCHNMAQRGPSAYPDSGRARPLICIGNNGDREGELQLGQGDVSAPPAFARAACELAAEIFADLALLAPRSDAQAPVAALNQPFGAGYILRHYTSDSFRRSLAPRGNYVGLMVEVNRGLFVGDQETRSPIQPINRERVQAVRERLASWIEAVCELIEAEGV